MPLRKECEIQMKNKKIITLIATLGLIACMHNKVDAVKFYDTLGTRYEGAVERLAELEIIDGVSEKTFNANRSVTRAEFAKLIVEASLKEEEIWSLSIDDSHCNFTDIAKDAWYYKYVVVATNYGYINGYNDNTFKPNKEVSYEEVAKMLMKALGHTYLVETDPRGWSAEYMDKLYSLNIADGTADFEKGEKATRGNVAILLWNTLTSNVWEKIWLNDVTGFTFVDSGKTLFDKKIVGYVFEKNLEIKGFREVNGKLCVKTSNVGYNQLFDQDITVNFSMIGGKTDVLYKIVRYAQGVIKYEIVGLSPDMDTQLYTGSIEELKNDGLSLRVPTERFSKDNNYGYYLKGSDDENSRLLTVNTKNKRFIIDKIDFKTDKVTIEEDEDLIIDNENDLGYLYKGEYEASTTTITINENYVIQDGAVLFKDNKRVDWDTVKVGDVITEIEKDKYYFVSRDKIEVTIENYEKTSDEIKFETSEGNFVAFRDTKCIEYYSVDNKVVELYKYSSDKLDAIIGTKVRLHLDFAGNIAKLEILEDYMKEETSDKVSSLQRIGIGYYSTFYYGDTDENNRVKISHGGNDKTYKTTLKSVNAEFGDLVVYKMEKANTITEIKTVSTGSALNDKFKLNKITSETLDEKIKKGNIVKDISVYHAKYYYDFGVYNKVIDFEVAKSTIDIIDSLNQEKVEYYAVMDNEEHINILLVMDYSEKKDVFYGKVNRIFLGENSNINIEIDVFGHKAVTYNVSGLINCEENEVISFELLGKDSIKVLEKFTVKSLGYYKDIIIKDISWNKKITAENGEINLEEGIIIADKKEYKISDFDVILLNIQKDKNGNWLLGNGKYLRIKDIKLSKNDRIAINEIEDTIIIYRGYEE